jgi:hypothetical protein
MSDRPTPLEFLEEVYLNEQLPLTVRMRAAIEAAPYRHSKKPSRLEIADDFGTKLERAIRASNRALLIEGRVVREGSDAGE